MTPGMDDGNILLTKFLREKMTENYRVSFCHIMSQKASIPRLGQSPKGLKILPPIVLKIGKFLKSILTSKK